MRTNFLKFSSLLIIAFAVVFSACKKEFDVPPVAELASLKGNITIDSLKAMASPTAVEITDSLILEAIVVGNDRTGNFYKQIVLQDSTGGIRIDVDAYDLYNEFKQGHKTWVLLKGLYIWQDGDVVAIVSSANSNSNRIPQALYKKYIVGGPMADNPIVPAVRKIEELTSADLNTLVQMEGMELADGFAGSTYADIVNQQTVNAELIQCSNKATIIVRNSGYADFAGQTTPTGNGIVTAVYNSFNGTKQLFIRDTTDMPLYGTRCTNLSTLISIASLRTQYTGTNVTASGIIEGIAISENVSSNFQSKNLIVQEEGGAGITVRFDADHSVKMGDKVRILTGGGEISEYKGLLQLGNVPVANVSVLSANNTITPRVATVQQVLDSVNVWESQLVQIKDATLSGATFSGNVGVTDASSASVNIYTFSGATYATAAVPQGAVAVNAVLSDYNGAQLLIRGASDVTGGTPLTYYLNETFDGLTTSQNAPYPNATLTGWSNIDEVGGKKWQAKEYSGNKYVEAYVFNTSIASMIAWWVSPSVTLTNDANLAFETAIAFHKHDGLEVFISEDFSGDVTTATWTKLTASFASASSSNYDWVSSGNIDLSAYTGKSVHFGFKYTGSDANGNTTTFQLDNVKVVEQ